MNGDEQGMVKRKVQQYADACRNLGFLAFCHYASQRIRILLYPVQRLRVLSRYSEHPLWCRFGSSDMDVFGQIFVHREYRCLDSLDVGQVQLIIDCGANVGFSSAYFLTRFPLARVIAVEPSEHNFEALQRNLAAFGDRVTCLRKAVWSKSGMMVPDLTSSAGDGREWSFSVREAAENETDGIEAIDMASLIGERIVDVLKIDIEGAESAVFSAQTEWLSQVKNLVIELHGTEAAGIFAAAVAPRGYLISTCDELTVCISPE